jgi:hypothetical protein
LKRLFEVYHQSELSRVSLLNRASELRPKKIDACSKR